MNSQYAIRCEQVTQRFASKEVLSGLSLQVPTTGILGLLGPNGAGKTTLMSLMLGYLRPSAGTITVLGKPPHQLHHLPGQVGALPQDADFSNTLRVQELLGFFARLAGAHSKAQIAHAVDQVLSEVDMRAAHNQLLSNLSFGMRKRIMIAQALMGQPQVMILDEPTAGLDPEHAYQVLEALKRRAQKAAIVISSHQLSDLEPLCDSAAFLVGGRLVANAPMEQLRRTEEEVNLEVKWPATWPTPQREARLTELAKTWGLQIRLAEQNPNNIALTPLTPADPDFDTHLNQLLKALIEADIKLRTLTRGNSLLTTYMNLIR